MDRVNSRQQEYYGRAFEPLSPVNEGSNESQSTSPNPSSPNPSNHSSSNSNTTNTLSPLEDGHLNEIGDTAQNDSQHSRLPLTHSSSNPDLRNTLSQSFQSFNGQLRESFPSLGSTEPQLAREVESNQRSPLARISFCAYPGRGHFSRGHSFIAIEPINPQFRSGGESQIGSNHQVGRLAVGVSPKGYGSSDRIFHHICPRDRSAQVRNDTRYLRKDNVRAVTIDIMNEEQLQRGLKRINQAAKAMDEDPCYIQHLNHIECIPPEEESQEPVYNLRKHNSNDFAMDFFRAFCDTLPPALENVYQPGIDSLQMWRKMKEPLPQRTERQFPQTIGWDNLTRLNGMRRMLPQAIGESRELLSNIKQDLTAFQNELNKTLKEAKALWNKYAPSAQLISLKLVDELNDEANIFNQAFSDFSAAINDAAALAESFDTPDNFIGLGVSLASSFLNSDSRKKAIKAITSFQQILQTAQSALNRIDEVAGVVPNAPDLTANFVRDLRHLEDTSRPLTNMALALPNRMIHYVSQLEATLGQIGQYFVDESKAS